MTFHAIPRATAPPAATEPRPDASRRRRVIEAAAFVTVWVTAGTCSSSAATRTFSWASL